MTVNQKANKAKVFSQREKEKNTTHEMGENKIGRTAVQT
jgi:hypothetical protein